MNQEIYDLIFKRIQDLGYDCYPFLPKEGTAYPFVVLGEVDLKPKATKSFSLGQASILHQRKIIQRYKRILADIS